MDVKTNQQKDTTKDVDIKKDNSKIYFFIIAIVALLLTNVYFYVKYKSSGEKLYTTALQKESLQREIDRIEAVLDEIQNQSSTIAIPENIASEEIQARKMIAQLRSSLERTDLTEAQLTEADARVTKLKSEVSFFKQQVSELKLQNDLLMRENEKLSSSVSEKSNEIVHLRNDNEDLKDKVGIASSIKVSNISINGLRQRRNDKEIEARAKRVDELQIEFTIAENPLAKTGEKEVYVRVVDPNGYLVADGQNMFVVHNNELQYTFKKKINFTNNGEQYEFTWNNDNKGFKKGAYTILLYADNAIMGRSSIVLK